MTTTATLQPPATRRPLATTLRHGGQWNLTLESMKATLSDMPHDLASWGFEFKWDGLRILAFCDQRRTILISRNQLDVSAQYPELLELHKHVKGGPCILDGEVVALNEASVPSFHQLQQRMHIKGAAAVAKARAKVPVMYVAFDLLYAEKKSWLSQPYWLRRRRLEALLPPGPHWLVPEKQIGTGPTMLEAARRLGFEGIIAKQLESTYQPGSRSPDWLKIKVRQEQEFVIGGWTAMKDKGEGTLGSLLVGYYEGSQLRYAGKVGTGFNEAERRRLVGLLQARKQAQCPFTPNPRISDAKYATPELIAEILFQEWTPAGRLRQPAYTGLRTDKKAREVVREKPQA